MANPPTLTPEQRQLALQKAAAARRQRAEVKDKLKIGSLTLPELFDAADTKDEAGEMLSKLKVVSVLESLPGVGKVRGAQPHVGTRHLGEPQVARTRHQPAQGAARQVFLKQTHRLVGAPVERGMDGSGSRAATRRGVLLVLAGTSGAGKGTVGARLRAREPDLGWSVSWTTRARRPGETEGVDYHYVSRAEFETLRDSGGFLESFEVYGDLKGTPKQFVVDQLAAGRDVLLEIDVQGAQAVKRALPEAVLVFVQAPSRDEQRRRLLQRAETTGESAESIAGRLARADEEERIGATEFDHLVVNDDADRAAREIAGILQNRRKAEGA